LVSFVNFGVWDLDRCHWYFCALGGFQFIELHLPGKR